MTIDISVSHLPPLEASNDRVWFEVGDGESVSRIYEFGTNRLRAAMYLLETPAGVTEFDINDAIKVMSGRNYPSELMRRFGITITRTKLKGTRRGSYTRYGIAGVPSARRLALLIMVMCRREGLVAPSKGYLYRLASAFAIHEAA